MSERLFLLPTSFLHPVRKRFPVENLFPGLRPNFGFPLRVTMVEVVSARLTSPEGVTTGIGTNSKGPPERNPIRQQEYCDLHFLHYLLPLR